MHKTQARRSISRGIPRAAVAIALSGAALTWGAPQASAQVLEGGLIGGAAGAIIGGAVGGSKGAGKGALIGGAAGALIGAAEAERRRQYAAPPPRRSYGPSYAARSDGLVYDVQTSLSRLGYDPGPLDGVYGRRTADAIAAYEYDHGLPVTGHPSPELLHHMIQRGG